MRVAKRPVCNFRPTRLTGNRSPARALRLRDGALLLLPLADIEKKNSWLIDAQIHNKWTEKKTRQKKRQGNNKSVPKKDKKTKNAFSHLIAWACLLSVSRSRR